MKEEKKDDWSVFQMLNAIDVNNHTEEKNGLTYLSWAWAWQTVKLNCPDADYEIVHWDGKPYLADPELGYMVETKVTIEGETKTMWLPVMDSANKAMLPKPQDIPIKNKNFKFAKLNPQDGKYYDKWGREQTEYTTQHVAAATMFDINKTIMRCLVKNLAMFGLGLYIYAGEDLPTQVKEDAQEQLQAKIKEACTAMLSVKSRDEYEQVWRDYVGQVPHENGSEFMNATMQMAVKFPKPQK